MLIRDALMHKLCIMQKRYEFTKWYKIDIMHANRPVRNIGEEKKLDEKKQRDGSQ